jgi:hypothetical protein
MRKEVQWVIEQDREGRMMDIDLANLSFAE